MVVKPETLSKKASVKLGTQPEKNKGRAPKRLAKNQAAATTIKASRGVMAIFFPLPSNNTITANAMQIIPGIKKEGITAYSW